MKNKNLEAIAVEILKNYPDMEVVYLTADGYGFSQKNHADSHAQTQADKKVYPFKRTENEREEQIVKDPKREELVATYTKLFEKAPPHNMKVETLEKKIAEKQEGLSKVTTTKADDSTNETVTESEEN